MSDLVRYMVNTGKKLVCEFSVSLWKKEQVYEFQCIMNRLRQKNIEISASFTVYFDEGESIDAVNLLLESEETNELKVLKLHGKNIQMVAVKLASFLSREKSNLKTLTLETQENGLFLMDVFSYFTFPLKLTELTCGGFSFDGRSFDTRTVFPFLESLVVKWQSSVKGGECRVIPFLKVSMPKLKRLTVTSWIDDQVYQDSLAPVLDKWEIYLPEMSDLLLDENFLGSWAIIDILARAKKMSKLKRVVLGPQCSIYDVRAVLDFVEDELFRVEFTKKFHLMPFFPPQCGGVSVLMSKEEKKKLDYLRHMTPERVSHGILFHLCSAITVERLGVCSYVRLLPVDLLRGRLKIMLI